MPPGRELTREQKDERNRKAREKRQNETAAEKEARCAANRERVQVNRAMKRLLNPEEEELARASRAKKARENRQAETPEERFLRQTLDKERKRLERANEKDAEHQARLLDQQQCSIQKEIEGNHPVGAEAEAQRQPAPLHRADYDVHLQAEELRLAITERQANALSEEENRARVEAEAERQANALQEEENQARLEAERLRQATLRQQEMADILAAMNRRPEAVRPRVLIQETEAEKLARLERKSSRQQTLHNKESEAEKWQRQKKDALAS